MLRNGRSLMCLINSTMNLLPAGEWKLSSSLSLRSQTMRVSREWDAEDQLAVTMLHTTSFQS
jgi:hypothetical protein